MYICECTHKWMWCDVISCVAIVSNSMLECLLIRAICWSFPTLPPLWLYACVWTLSLLQSVYTKQSPSLQSQQLMQQQAALMAATQTPYLANPVSMLSTQVQQLTSLPAAPNGLVSTAITPTSATIGSGKTQTWLDRLSRWVYSEGLLSHWKYCDNCQSKVITFHFNNNWTGDLQNSGSKYMKIK